MPPFPCSKKAGNGNGKHFIKQLILPQNSAWCVMRSVTHKYDVLWKEDSHTYAERGSIGKARFGAGGGGRRTGCAGAAAGDGEGSFHQQSLQIPFVCSKQKCFCSQIFLQHGVARGFLLPFLHSPSSPIGIPGQSSAGSCRAPKTH